MLLLLPSLALAAVAHAAPSRANVFSKRADNVRPETWVPVVAIVILIIAVVSGAMVWRRKKRQIGARPAVATRNGVTAELTAEQLAGRPAAGTPQTNATGRRPRRNNRRTASQMSTKSLPAYNKEPGDQELLVYRAPEEEGGNVTTAQMTVIMPAVEETDSPRGSADLGLIRAASYPPEPDSPTDQPLLSHASMTHDQDLTPATLMTPASAAVNDERGAAPSYETATAGSQPVTLNSAPPSPERPSSPPDNRRRSVIRSLFMPTHGRGESNASANTSSSHSHGASPEQPRARAQTHRPSASQGSSLLRTLSRMGSNGTLGSAARAQLTSPSAISLASIGSPLSHTLTRTEIVYPKTGPTPEQMRLISSRESLGRFGRPYGADAIAFAASTSQLHMVPPPEFEEVEHGIDGLPVTSPSGPTHARTGSADSGSSHGSLPEAPAEEPEPAPTPIASPSVPSAQPAGVPVPPSAFRSPPAERPGAESRASSYMSYATAADTMEPASPASSVHAPTVGIEPPSRSESRASEREEMDAPPTPRVGAKTMHVAEPTDATIRPGMVPTTVAA